jgi:hypothetical protein
MLAGVVPLGSRVRHLCDADPAKAVPCGPFASRRFVTSKRAKVATSIRGWAEVSAVSTADVPGTALAA